MGNRRNGQSWARTEFGGMPVWGLALAAFVMAVIAVLTLTNLPRASEATGTYTPRPSSSLLANLDRPVVAFIGDSYTAGDLLSESERTALRWPAIMSRAMDLREANYGVGGSGYTVAGPFQNASTYEERIPQVTPDADVIIVSGGRNDQDTDLYADAVNSFFPALRSAFPNAQIIALEPFWDSSEYPERLDQLSTLIRTSVEGVGGRYVDGPGDALIGHPEWILEDGVHPNVQGHAELARVVGDDIGPITVTQSTEPVAAIWIGDSFTEGSQVDESQRFATLVSAHFGWKATNQAEGGTGYVADGPDNFPDRGPFTEHVARTVAAKPGVVIVAGGMNDQDLDLSENEIREAVEETLRGLREGLPAAEIYVIGPFWNNGYPTPAVERERGVVQDVAASLSIPFIDPIGGEWITGTNDGREKGNRVDYIGQDGTHPNVAGQAWIAQKIIAAIEAARPAAS